MAKEIWKAVIEEVDDEGNATGQRREVHGQVDAPDDNARFQAATARLVQVLPAKWRVKLLSRLSDSFS